MLLKLHELLCAAQHSRPMLPPAIPSPVKPRRLSRISLPSLPGMCMRSPPIKDGSSTPASTPERASLASERSELHKTTTVLV